MRLNVEGKFFSDVDFLYAANDLDWSPWTVIGLLNCLWFGSQQRDRYEGAFDDICKWSRMDLYGPNEDPIAIVEVLTKHGFLSKVRGDFYLIHGNKDQIEGRISRTEMAKKAANSRWGKDKNSTPKKGENSSPQKQKLGGGGKGRSTPPNPTKNTAESDSMPPHMQEHAITMQGNARQCNSMQGNTKQYNADNTIGIENSNPLPVADAQGGETKSRVPAIWQARIDGDDRAIAKDWFEYANQVTPKNSYTIEKFEEAICRIRVTHGYTNTHIRQLFEFIKQDEFWCSRAVSPLALLKPSKSDPGIIKLEQVVRSLKHRPKSKMEKLEEDLARQVQEGGSCSFEYFLGIEPLKNVTEASNEPT